MLKLLTIFRSDFGATDDEILSKLIEFIRSEELKKKIEKTILNQTDQPKIIFRDYDWKINANK